MQRPRRWLASALLLGLLAGCASVDEPVSSSGPRPPPDMTRPANSSPAWPAAPDERQAKTLISQLLPSSLNDKTGWTNDLHAAFNHLKIPQLAETYCAALAIIAQESGFQVDPVVPHLPDIVWRELGQRAAKYGIPMLLITSAMRKSSPDGRSYQKRIDTLKSEMQLNALFNDMIAEFPFGPKLLAGYNPVRTAGPMQVSIEFAEQQVQETPYPYALTHSLRDEVFTRRGGLYFGSAILLDYPAPYTDVVYRFADFNAGRYSSRNAAFQSALGRLAGQALILDGDLLRYQKGQPSAQTSSVEIAARSLASQLKMSHGEIRRDLRLEKTSTFNRSPLFVRVFALAEKAGNKPLPRQVMPQIDLKSPKISRKLTTEWFARRVEGRYRSCLKRAESLV
ncbi:MAG: DUF1615 domain-containing protein [Betaproteobacteria bacterium HGW-Betaproteobacteria-10]|nr:MAG: DUF1615 domain-containing protein [Betaproteobacteria bacterium HGW-Betaproteobacteria-10]